VLDPTFGTTNPPPPAKPETGSVKSVKHIGKELVIIGTVVDNAFAAPAEAAAGRAASTSTVTQSIPWTVS
jgi:hypothetical protein